MRRAVVEVMRRGLRALQPAIPSEERGFLVLAYHLVGAGTESPVDVPLPDFRRQIREIRSLARPLSLDDALDELSGSGSAPGGRPAVVVTFDDAYKNFFQRALPVLAGEDVPATLFVPTGFIDGGIEAPIRSAPRLAAATWDEIADAAAGHLVTIGSHGVSHRNLVLADVEAARREIEESRRILRRRLGVPITSFCYPEGFATPRAQRLVRATYRCGLASGGTRVLPGRRDWSALPRLPVRRDMPASFEAILRSRAWLEEVLAARVRRLRVQARRILADGERDR